MHKATIIMMTSLIMLFLVLGACTAPAAESQSFPPPEGYSSWDAYYEATGQSPATTTPPETTEVAPPPPPTPTQTSFEPIVLTGSGEKTTPPFTVTTTEWIIEWSYTSDNPEFAVFGFFVYPRGETVSFVESCLFPEGTSGSTYSYAGAGEYYVKVTAANIKSWTITIKPA